MLELKNIKKIYASGNEKVEALKPLNTVVTKKEYSVHKRSNEIMKKITKCKKIKFEQLFEIREKNSSLSVIFGW